MKRRTNPTKEALKETALKITHDHIAGLEKQRLLKAWATQQKNVKTPLGERKRALITALAPYTQ